MVEPALNLLSICSYSPFRRALAPLCHLLLPAEDSWPENVVSLLSKTSSIRHEPLLFRAYPPSIHHPAAIQSTISPFLSIAALQLLFSDRLDSSLLARKPAPFGNVQTRGAASPLSSPAIRLSIANVDNSLDISRQLATSSWLSLSLLPAVPHRQQTFIHPWFIHTSLPSFGPG